MGVVVTFIDNKGTEQETYQTYSNQIMPLTIKNSELPKSRNGAFTWDSEGGNTYNSCAYFTIYRGFVCKEITFQTTGGITLYRLVFSESGQSSINCFTGNNVSYTETYYDV